MKSTRIIIIGALMIVILMMAVGYSALATQLNFNGTAEIVGEWNIRITNVEVQDTSGGAEPGNPEYTNTRVTFNAKLEKPGDSITYAVTIENAGTIDAMLKTLYFQEDDKNGSPAIIYTIKEPAMELKAGEQTTLLINVVYDENTTEMPEIRVKTITGIVEYDQK